MPRKNTVLKVNNVTITDEVNANYILGLLKDSKDNIRPKPAFIPYYRILSCFDELETIDRLVYDFLLNQINIKRTRVTKEEIEQKGGYSNWFHSCEVKLVYTDIYRTWGIGSKKTVKKSLDTLEDLGFITTIEFTKLGKRKKVVCNYDLLYELPVQIAKAWVEYEKKEGIEIPDDVQQNIEKAFSEIYLTLNKKSKVKNKVKSKVNNEYVNNEYNESGYNELNDRLDFGLNGSDEFYNDSSNMDEQWGLVEGLAELNSSAELEGLDFDY